jgi:hypothetical protein
MIIQQSRIYRHDLRANPHVLYVFGDNEERIGYGGQAAEMRDEHNAAGVATLKAPGVFWTEDDTERQCTVIDADLARIIQYLAGGGLVVWPLDGIGTGLAALEQNAPSTWAHLQERVRKLPYINGLTWSPAQSPAQFTREVMELIP